MVQCPMRWTTHHSLGVTVAWGTEQVILVTPCDTTILQALLSISPPLNGPLSVIKEATSQKLAS